MWAKYDYMHIHCPNVMVEQIQSLSVRSCKFFEGEGLLIRPPWVETVLRRYECKGR